MATEKKPLKKRIWLGAYGRGWAGVPTLLTAASWPAIWLLWPSMTPPVSSRQPTATHLAQAAPSEWFLTEPATVFVSPWEQTRLTEGDEIPALAAFEVRPGQPAALTRHPAAIEWPDPGNPAIRRPQHQHPAPTSFSAPEAHDAPSVVLRLSSTLAAKAFALPDSARDALNIPHGSGSLVLLVDIGSTGKPEAVFIEHGSGDHAFDRAAVHAIYQGQALAGMPGFGRVFIVRPVR